MPQEQNDDSGTNPEQADDNPEQQDPRKTAGGGNESEQDRQLYFEQLAAVQNSILEGVITYW